MKTLLGNLRSQALVLALLLLAAVCFTPEAKAGYGRTPYYSGWKTKGNYSYRMYNYYAPAYGGYRKHVAIYYPSQPRYVYYYNPYKHRYWGRYDLQTGGYSTLAPEDRSDNLADIDEADFPEPGSMPTPEDGEDALLPPNENVPASRPQVVSPSIPSAPIFQPKMMAPARSAPSCHGY